jgi:hypothetical protein
MADLQTYSERGDTINILDAPEFWNAQYAEGRDIAWDRNGERRLIPHSIIANTCILISVKQANNIQLETWDSKIFWQQTKPLMQLAT